MADYQKLYSVQSLKKMKSEPLNQYTEICRDAIKSSSAKLSKTYENLLLEILLLYMTIQRKINFTQMERYGTHC